MAEFVMNGCAVNADGHLTLDGVDTVEMAKKYGATHTINSRKENVVERVKEITGGHM